jgi:hypothetical protein
MYGKETKLRETEAETGRREVLPKRRCGVGRRERGKLKERKKEKGCTKEEETECFLSLFSSA